MGSHAAWVLLLRPSLRCAGQRRDVLPHSVPPPGKEPTLTDGRHSRAIVDETGWGAHFSQLIADGIVAEKLPAGMPPGQQRPAEGRAVR